ncbi:low molecular weight protein arginine phosphatase [Mucisphaera calidilacus]|uniref:protein-tyrosine-phosphatase n=1 Tax=Mucisphaera calidilacus TaxID=2527982 RepID=A0A518BXU2_9BACT|nr:low molecular weight protein arginine phosphatase [Mucisphaera calidilacus]QDU71791.1 Low molecular weight protein-tyrosine-phosphatase YwlE [Mucisphaera calidilacus]
MAERVKSLLLVCTGNTCRSPMAEVIARDLLARRHGVEAASLGDAGVEVGSAGVMTMGGSAASPEAVAVMAERGLDLSGHVSRGLTHELVRGSDLILAMTQGHLEALLSVAPEARDRAGLLDSEGDIEDPIGQSMVVYRDVADRMSACLERVLATYSF